MTGEGSVTIEEAVPRSRLSHLVAERGPLVLAPGGGQDEQEVAAGEGFREGVVAPLRPGDPKTGYLLAADRAFSHEGLGGDLQLLEALAANTAAALRKGGLIDKLRNEAAVREYEAHHDSLTGLPNRVLFAQHLERALKELAETARVTLVLLDLDGFKQVNDTLGHESGDAVLSEIARRRRPWLTTGHWSPASEETSSSCWWSTPVAATKAWPWPALSSPLSRRPCSWAASS